MPRKQTWAEQVRAARKNIADRLGQAQWTQAQMAQALGVAPNHVAMWERGERQPSNQSIRSLIYCQALALKGIDPRSL
jgi:transcriptional regulator with XRE-family HTH domain